MSMMDLIGDLVATDSPPVAHSSPLLRHAESLASADDSPHSPHSPDDVLRNPVRAYRWTVLTADGDPCEVWLSPPGTADQAMQGIQGALTAEPDRWLTVGCATCRHLSRPGLADGYCSIRTDLAPAYGEHHPLRRLPDDRGASCAKWGMHE